MQPQPQQHQQSNSNQRTPLPTYSHNGTPQRQAATITLNHEQDSPYTPMDQPITGALTPPTRHSSSISPSPQQQRHPDSNQITTDQQHLSTLTPGKTRTIPQQIQQNQQSLPYRQQSPTSSEPSAHPSDFLFLHKTSVISIWFAHNTPSS